MHRPPRTAMLAALSLALAFIACSPYNPLSSSMNNATRIASTMLPGSARSRPARSKAVPWSGEVRTIRKPAETFTARPADDILRGIKPWS